MQCPKIQVSPDQKNQNLFDVLRNLKAVSNKRKMENLLKENSSLPKLINDPSKDKSLSSI